MKLSYRIAFAVILLLFAKNNLFAQTSRLTGTIRSEFGPLESANVSIAGQTAVTNRNGLFFFSLGPGTYAIVITHVGYKKIETSITIVPGKENIKDFNMIPNDLLDEITIMGSRVGKERSNLFTAVPVDVISSSRLMQTGQPILIQMLNYSLPSFNAERQSYDEPVTYRGMDPNHLLITLNNTRYHNSAWLNTGTPKANLGRGSAINDLGTIPTIAVDKVEVLRDGATPQYGSDAIAGVLNIRLKESTGKLLINASIGQFYAGDGFKSWLGLYRGFRLRNKNPRADKQGFISVAAEFRTQEATTRRNRDTGLVYETFIQGMSWADVRARDDSQIAANGFNRDVLTRNSEKAKVNSGLLVNGRYPINNRLKLFWTVTGNYKNAPSGGNYRRPNRTPQVNKFLYPNGFKPYYKTINWDATAIAGIKGITKNDWNWELSSSFGNNTNTNDVYNSNNASQQDILGLNAPTSFYLGKMVYNLFTNNISFTKDLSHKNNNEWSSKIIMGAEWRLENYKLKEGDEAATMDYDGAGPKQGGSQPSSGSVSSGDAVNKNRSASSVYVNLELEPNDHLLIDMASRYEYYSDFGSNLAGKLATRYKFSPKFSIRGSVSNGYRAPSLQQRYFSGIQGFRGSSQTVRVFNNESNITRAFHIPSLTAERALNLSTGFTSRVSPSVSFTLDGYLIQLRNRIIISGIFDRTKDPQIHDILVDYPAINLVQFFANAINTRTYGIDAVLNGNWAIQKTRIGLTLAANINRHAVFGAIKTTDVVENISNYTNTLFGVEERTTLKRDQPGEKVILSAVVNKGKFGFVLRNTFFGSTESTTILATNPVDTAYDFFSSRILTDWSINYKPKLWLSITLGANNIFNVYPDRRIRDNEYNGGSIPYGTNGGYYYLNMRFEW
jgi:iron complex outermembrane receptor protein